MHNKQLISGIMWSSSMQKTSESPGGKNSKRSTAAILSSRVDSRKYRMPSWPRNGPKQYFILFYKHERFRERQMGWTAEVLAGRLSRKPSAACCPRTNCVTGDSNDCTSFRMKSIHTLKTSSNDTTNIGPSHHKRICPSISTCISMLQKNYMRSTGRRPSNRRPLAKTCLAAWKSKRRGAAIAGG